MGVYIDMEMPKEIEPALVIEFCEDLGGKRYARFYHYRYGGLTDWHEVIELHEPHGQLGDLDELFRTMENKGWFNNADRDIAEDIVLNAATIIPASEEGE